MTRRVSFTLEGIAPTGDPLYRTDPAARRWFWREAKRVGLRVKRNSLVKGLDARGMPLAPIHVLTRQARRDDVNPVTGRGPYSPMGRARENAPPLMATGRRSRTYTLLRANVRGESVVFSWGNDPHTGRNWGDILKRHATGFARHFVYPTRGWGFVKGRDVIGLSKADVAAIREEMAKRWADYKATAGRRERPDRVFLSGIVRATDFDTGVSRDMPGRRFFSFTGPGDQRFRNLPPPIPPPPPTPTPPPILPPPPTPTPPRTPLAPLTPAAILPRSDRVALPRGVSWDDPIPQWIAAELPPGLAASRTWRELFATRAGRLWWRDTGSKIRRRAS